MLKSPYFYIYVKICLSSCSGVSVLCAFLVAVNAYGPSPPILSGVSRITHSSPDLMNQEKFSRFFNILKYFFYLLRTRACLIRFMYPALTFSDFVLSVYFPFVSLPFWLASFSLNYQRPHFLKNSILPYILDPFSNYQSE